MHPVYEYIVTILIMSLVIGFSFYAVNSMSSTQLTLTKEPQLNILADNLFNKILMTPGYPVDWGFNIYVNESNLADFGLASSNGHPYQLDIDKVLRLTKKVGNTTNPLYIPPETAGRLLGLYMNGHWNYGFRLIIYSALNISIKPLNLNNNPPSSYLISVYDYLGRPATNAFVEGALYAIYVENNANANETFNYIFSKTHNYTSVDGFTTLNFDVSSLPSNNAAYVLIVNAYYYGLKSQGMWVNASILDLVIDGQYLIVNMSGITNIVPSAWHLALSAIEFTSDLGIVVNPVENVTNGEAGEIINKGHYNYRVYKLANEVSDDIIFIGLLVKTTGKYFILYSPRPRVPITVEYSSHSFSIYGLRTKVVYSLFKIGDYSYYAKLYVWRMSE